MAEKAITWYNRLKEAINGLIKQNGKREITGVKLNSVLNQMVDALGKNMTFGGVVSPATVIDNTDDNPVFYLALEAGNYPYCGNIVVGQGQIAFLFRDANNIWHQASWNAPDENFTTEEKEKLQGLPTVEELREALGAKANAPESKPGSDNLASFDEEGNLKDSGVSIPVPTEEEKEHVLSSGETGLEWVPKPVDGKSALDIYNDLNPNARLDEAGFIAKLQQKYPMKHAAYYSEAVSKTIGTPFTGELDNNGLLPTPETMGNLYIMPNSGTNPTGSIAFTTINTGENQYVWVKLGPVEVPDNALTEEMVDNECVDGATNKPASAKVVTGLKATLDGCEIIEEKVLLDGNNTLDNSYVKVNNANGAVTINTDESYNSEVVLVNVRGCKSVRFSAVETTSTGLGYALGYFTNTNEENFVNFDIFNVVRRGVYYYSNPATLKEYIIDIPNECTHLFVTARVAGDYTIDDFYCYKCYNKKLKDVIVNKVDNDDFNDFATIEKNLINVNDCIFGVFCIGSTIQNNVQGVMSNKVVLIDGEKYTLQNVAIVGTNELSYIANFDNNDELIGYKSISANVVGTTGTYSGQKYGYCSFTFSKPQNYAYSRVTLQTTNTLKRIWLDAQLEVGEERTEVVSYGEVRKYNVANKEYVDGKIAEAVAPMQEQIDTINENITIEVEEAVVIERDYEFKDGNGSYLHNKTFSTNTIMEDPDNTLAFVKSTKWAVVRYEVEDTKTYIGKTLNADDNNGVYIFYWADIQKKFIKREGRTPASGWTITRLTPPANAAYLYIQTLNSTVNQVSLEEVITINKTIKDIIDENINNILEKIDSIESNKDSIKVLVIGDSFVIDPFAYVPIMLQKMYKDIDFVIGIAMESYQKTPQVPTLDGQGYLPSGNTNPFYHGTIAAHLRFLTIQEDYDQYNYYKYSSDDNVWSYSEKKLKDTLIDEDWDCIVIRANHQSGITSDGNIKFIDNDDPNNPTHVNGYGENYNYDNLVDRLRNAIMKHVNHPVKFGALIPQRSPKDFFPDPNSSNPTDSLAVVNSIDGSIQSVFSAAQLYMQYSFFDFVIPVGTALQNARHIEQLRAFGDGINYEGVWNTNLNRWDVYPNNTNAGYMNCSDAHHLQDGIGREICAYTICLKLLELACNQKSIFGDNNYILKKDVNNYLVPAQKGSTAAGFIVKEDNYSEEKNLDIENYNQCLLRIIQKCSQLAVKNPYTIETGMDIICAADIEELNSLKSAIDNED